jgi:hypothetical protein
LIFGQTWIDTLYSIQTQTDISYGIQTDFAGASQDLKLDISYPVGDVSPACGRPLLVMIHGGGWFAGDKSDGYAKRIREDFTKRGYTATNNLEANTNDLPFKIFPNPANDFITIQFDKNYPSVDVQIVNLLGKVIVNTEVQDTQTYKIELNHLATGIYLVRVKVEERVFTKKLVVN